MFFHSLPFVKQILNVFKLEFIDLLENVHNESTVFVQKFWQVKPIPVYKSIGLCITFKVNKRFGTCPKKGKVLFVFWACWKRTGTPHACSSPSDLRDTRAATSSRWLTTYWSLCRTMLHYLKVVSSLPANISQCNAGL